jgi:hypothetical protein
MQITDFPKPFFTAKILESLKADPNGKYVTFRLAEIRDSKKVRWKILSLKMGIINQ